MHGSLSIDTWFAVGGVIGAVIRRMRARDEGSDWKNYVVDSVLGALGGPLMTIAILGFDWGELLMEGMTPFQAVAVGAVPSYVGLDLLTLASAKLRGTPSIGAVKTLIAESKPTHLEARDLAHTALKSSELEKLKKPTTE